MNIKLCVWFIGHLELFQNEARKHTTKNCFNIKILAFSFVYFNEKKTICSHRYSNGLFRCTLLFVLCHVVYINKIVQRPRKDVKQNSSYLTAFSKCLLSVRVKCLKYLQTNILKKYDVNVQLIQPPTSIVIAVSTTVSTNLVHNIQ